MKKILFASLNTAKILSLFFPKKNPCVRTKGGTENLQITLCAPNQNVAHLYIRTDWIPIPHKYYLIHGNNVFELSGEVLSLLGFWNSILLNTIDWAQKLIFWKKLIKDIADTDKISWNRSKNITGPKSKNITVSQSYSFCPLHFIK